MRRKSRHEWDNNNNNNTTVQNLIQFMDLQSQLEDIGLSGVFNLGQG